MIVSFAPHDPTNPLTRLDTPLGTILAGSVSVADFSPLVDQVVQETGFDRIDQALPSLLGSGVVAVIGTEESLKEWHYQWDSARLEEYPHDPIGWWMRSTKRGVASMWLVSFLTGHEVPPECRHWFGLPVDSESFGRCLNALDLLDLNGHVGRLRALAATTDDLYPWGVVGVRWAELVDLYRSGRLEELTGLLREICRTRADGSRQAFAWSPDGGTSTDLDAYIDYWHSVVVKEALAADELVPDRPEVEAMVIRCLEEQGWRIDR